MSCTFQTLCLSWPLKDTVYELRPGHKLWVLGGRSSAAVGTIQEGGTILQATGMCSPAHTSSSCLKLPDSPWCTNRHCAQVANFIPEGTGICHHPEHVPGVYSSRQSCKLNPHHTMLNISDADLVLWPTPP